MEIREGTEKIEFPAFLTKLGDGSFSFCGLEKAALHDGVKYYSGSTTQKYVFAGNEDAVFTYQGRNIPTIRLLSWILF